MRRIRRVECWGCQGGGVRRSGLWRRRSGLTEFAGLCSRKGREISQSDEKVPPCDADAAIVPPLSIRQYRRTPGCCGAGAERGSRITKSAAAPHLRVRRHSRTEEFAATLDSQRRRRNCRTGEKVPPCHVDRAETPPSRTKRLGGYPDTSGPELARELPGGGTNVDGRIRRDRASPPLQHRSDGGEIAERAKKSLPATLIARKPLHSGGGGGRHY